MSAPSPFIPGTNLQHTWDSTSLGWLKECPRKYQYQMIEGWRRKGTTSVHLTFGQHYHSALELYDKLKAASPEGFDHEDAVRTVLLHLLEWTWERVDCPTCKGQGASYSEPQGCTDCLGTGYDGNKGGPWEADHPSKNRNSLIRSVIWHLDEFKDDPVETLILANGKPAVELTFKFDSGIPIDYIGVGGGTNEGMRWLSETVDDRMEGKLPQTFMLSGHLDRIGMFAGDPYVLDHKTTTGSLDSRFYDQFNPHNQMSLYTIAGQVVFNAPIKGVIINGVQVGVGFTRFGRAFTLRTEPQSEEYLADLAIWLRLAETYAAAGRWPKNETACSNYGGCPFRQVCASDPAIRQRTLETYFERNHWNPLEDR